MAEVKLIVKEHENGAITFEIARSQGFVTEHEEALIKGARGALLQFVEYMADRAMKAGCKIAEAKTLEALGIVQDQPSICKTCRFWGNSSDPDWIHPARFCSHPSQADAYNPKSIKSDSAIFFDEGGCTGCMCTMPEFGCIHYEQNAEAQGMQGRSP